MAAVAVAVAVSGDDDNDRNNKEHTELCSETAAVAFESFDKIVTLQC